MACDIKVLSVVLPAATSVGWLGRVTLRNILPASSVSKINHVWLLLVLWLGLSALFIVYDILSGEISNLKPIHNDKIMLRGNMLFPHFNSLMLVAVGLFVVVYLQLLCWIPL